MEYLLGGSKYTRSDLIFSATLLMVFISPSWRGRSWSAEVKGPDPSPPTSGRLTWDLLPPPQLPIWWRLSKTTWLTELLGAFQRGKWNSLSLISVLIRVPPPFFSSGRENGSASEKYFPSRSFKVFGDLDCQISQKRKKYDVGLRVIVNIQPVLRGLGKASGTAPWLPPLMFAQLFELADPGETAPGWSSPPLANLGYPFKSCPPKTNPLPPPPSLSVFEFLSLLPKPDFLFLRKKLLKYPFKKSP